MRIIDNNKYENLFEMPTLRYADNEMVGLGNADNLIKITINSNEHEKPHFNIVIGKTVIRIDLDTLAPLNDEPNWRDYLTKKQFNAILDWAAVNRKKLIDIYKNSQNPEDFIADFTKLEENIDINKKVIYNSTPAIDSAEIVDDNYIKTYFKCGLVKVLYIDDLIKLSPNFYKDLKNTKILNNFTVYLHCIIWNDDLDLAGSYIWKFGEIV